MTTFEYVFGLLSLMTSLALTALVAGVVRLLRDEKVRDVPPVDWLWIWIAFAFTVGNWGSFWSLRTIGNWSAWLVLLLLLFLIVQFALCEFVVPDPQRSRTRDAEAHARDRRRAVIAVLIMIALSILLNATFALVYAGWLRDSLLSASAAVVLVPMLIWRGPKVQLAGSAILAGMTTFFLWMTSSILVA